MAGPSTLAATVATNLFFTDANGLVGYDSAGFRGELNFNTIFTNFAFNLSAPDPNPSVNQAWAASADLATGQLKASSTVNNDGSNIEFSGGVTSVIAAFGDTVTYNGTASGGQPISANIGIAGTWAATANAGATIENTSYLRVYFLTPGSFNSPRILADGNIIAQAIWGIGPDAIVNPFVTGSLPYSGFIGTFPGSVSLPVDIASLPSGFEVVVLLQTIMAGNTHGTGSFDWNTDLSHTLNVILQAPAGVSLSTAGGLPTSGSGASTPEPASMLMAALGGALLVVLKYRKGSGLQIKIKSRNSA